MNPVPDAAIVPEAARLRTLKLILEYDGTEFCGWQIQPGLRTVQAEVENALGRLCGERVHVTGAGRTDTGVHALGQVVSFRTASSRPTEVLYRGLNGTLPRDVRVLSVEETHDGFDARRSAVRRVYRYVISKRVRAIGRMYAWHARPGYEVDRIVRASEHLTGDHCWKAFCRPDPQRSECRSRVFYVRWRDDAECLEMEIAAERYFHHMVRIVVGTLVAVGCGAIPADAIPRALESGDRNDAGPTAPAHGLTLLRVEYP